MNESHITTATINQAVDTPTSRTYSIPTLDLDSIDYNTFSYNENLSRARSQVQEGLMIGVTERLNNVSFHADTKQQLVDVIALSALDVTDVLELNLQDISFAIAPRDLYKFRYKALARIEDGRLEIYYHEDFILDILKSIESPNEPSEYILDMINLSLDILSDTGSYSDYSQGDEEKLKNDFLEYDARVRKSLIADAILSTIHEIYHYVHERKGLPRTAGEAVTKSKETSNWSYYYKDYEEQSARAFALNFLRKWKNPNIKATQFSAINIVIERETKSFLSRKSKK